ncbi:MarR family winged helix-turn-helix transcriptional regulator [Nakamurella deserti]|uniref:MarR family winged helix-turn-helix transcriptional regulator n=1 Tax=Nakamurella deserti TaxID=2164074 RepID=UPI00197C60BF|nr:MarR family winged helix-turn-helix transcriptional regulator [Nakamurella deserti]
MSQVDLPTSIGYALKRAATALRTAMDATLRDCGLSVAQYAALELLVQRAGLTNAELARGVFVTRQATHQLLAGLADAGLIRIEGAGRHQRAVVTPVGRTLLTDASTRVAAVERRMLAGLSPERQRALFGDLTACTAALQPDDADPA